MFFHISINARRKNAERWGDLQYAQGLQRAFAAKGIGAETFFRDDAPSLTGKGDIALRISGPLLEEPLIGLPNFLWLISPPNLLTREGMRKYQGVYVASRVLAQRISDSGVPAKYLQQATEPGHFHPGRRPEGANEYPIVFVGSYTPRAPRKSVLAAIEAGLEVDVWGPGWEGVIPERMWRGKHLDYDQLAETYARARIVLNDHRPDMSLHGMMSNRSYDAIASGAVVISDPVEGFSDPSLPELIQQPPGKQLVDCLRALLAEAPADMATRLERHRRIVERYSFDAVAASFAADAEKVIAAGMLALPDFRPKSTGIAPSVALSAVTRSAGDQRSSMLAAALEIRQIFAALEYPVRGGFIAPPPLEKAEEGVIHPLMYDQRRVQDLALSGATEFTDADTALLTRANRVADGIPTRLLSDPKWGDALAVYHMRGEPLWTKAPEGYARDDQKRHLVLWPKNAPPEMERPVGIFMHLFYDDLGQEIARRLAGFPVDHRVYVSTDTHEKAARLRDFFPDAEIRVLPNRGRDIYPKLYGFSDVYDRHDIVLHLHGKKSPHAGKLDQWLKHCLDCLLPASDQINRILSLFQSVPSLGLLAPVTFKGVLGAAHWGANSDMARELAYRMSMRQTLIDDIPRFPVGSMFWGRTDALRPLIDLDLRPAHFPPEAGQIDGTVAHAIERMIGVTCVWTGHRALLVAPAESKLYARFQKRFERNADVHLALESGEV